MDLVAAQASGRKPDWLMSYEVLRACQVVGYISNIVPAEITIANRSSQHISFFRLKK